MSRKNPSDDTKHHASARVMILFVLAFMAQYWTYCLFGLWYLVGEPAYEVVWLFVVFFNAGGVYNMMIFYVMRSRQRHRAVKPK